MRMLRSLLYLLAAASVSAQTITYDCATDGANCNVAMPDPAGSTLTGVTSTIEVPSLCGTTGFVSNITPRIDVTHPNVGDLQIHLVAPSISPFGTVDLLFRPLNFTGSCTGNDVVASFSDSAPPFACAPAGPANGTDPVRPDNGSLTAMLPFAETGTWTLELLDAAAPNTGALNGWSLTFTCSPLNVVSIVATDPTGFETGDPIVFTVTRTGNTILPLFVRISLSGTAVPADYATLPFSGVNFNPGESTATLVITPLSDGSFEGDETVIATIDPSVEYVVGTPASATGTIAELAGTEIPTLSPWMLVVFAAAVAIVALARS